MKKQPGKNVRRPRTSKPKIVEIEGHQLTESMHADYEQAVQKRRGQLLLANASDISDPYALGLGDFLAGYRPSRKIRVQLPLVHRRLSNAMSAMASMKDYPFYITHGPVRDLGCDTLNGLALELQAVSATLAYLVAAIRAENSTKVQDWLERADVLEGLGNSREFAHGNAEVSDGKA